MRLSEINETPLYTTTLPSTKETVKFRPFLVAEERALLTAGESEDQHAMLASMENVVNACLISKVDNLTCFDVEYLFITIRSKSVSETSDIVIECTECHEVTTSLVNLKDVTVHVPEGHNKKVTLSEEKLAMMKYPDIDMMLSIDSAADKYEALIKKVMHSVYYKDQIFVIAEEPAEELDKFLSTLTSKEYNQLIEFIDTIPYTQIKHSWVCKNPNCGAKQHTELKGIFSFF